MRYSNEEKVMWVEDWRQSGKRVAAYARENGLNPQTLEKWTKRESVWPECFVEVSATVQPPARSASEILIEKGTVRIHIPLELGSGELRAVMEGLGSVL